MFYSDQWTAYIKRSLPRPWSVAVLLEKMINLWILLMIAFTFFMDPVVSPLPKHSNGVPRAINFINRHLQTADVQGLSGQVAQKMKIWGIDELKRYCDQLDDNFVEECARVHNIHQAINVNHEYNWNFVQEDANILNGYLSKMKSVMRYGETTVKRQLMDAFVKNGWTELKEFCHNNNNDWTDACDYVQRTAPEESSSRAQPPVVDRLPGCC